MEWLYLIALLISALGTVLAWLAKLKWSSEFSDAKNAVIASKEAEIRAIKAQLDTLHAFSSPKMREYFLSTKVQLEEFVERLQKDLKDAKEESNRLTRQLQQQSNEAERRLADVLKQVALTETQKKDLANALQETRAAASSNILHEVAQPAFAGLLAIEALRRRDREEGRSPDKAPVEYYLKKNVEVSLRMVAFLNDRARISDSDTNYSEKPINLLGDVVADVVNLVRFSIYENFLRDSGAQIDSREIADIPSEPDGEARRVVDSVGDAPQYHIEYDQTLSRVCLYVVKYRLQQVFYSLLRNALKYKGEQDHYRVQIVLLPETLLEHPWRPYYVLDVTDHGVGIDDDETEVIFDLFRQGRRARHVSRIPGTGRGLFVSRTVLRGIGGDIYVFKSRNPTTFRLLIPRECAEAHWDRNVEALRERTRALLAEHVPGKTT